MRSFHYRLGLGICMLLTGCAASGNYYTQTVSSWRGGNVNALIKQWGSPDLKMPGPGNNTLYVYKTNSYAVNRVGGQARAGVNMSGNRPVLISQQQNEYDAAVPPPLPISCLAMFGVNTQGKIVSTQIRGSSCYGSAAFARNYGNR